MGDDLDRDVRDALRAIPEDTTAPARLVTALTEARRPIKPLWIVGGALAAGFAGFAVAFLQGPVTAVAGDSVMIFLSGAL